MTLSDEEHKVYADPAGHPFGIGWGHPSREALAASVKERLGQGHAPRNRRVLRRLRYVT